MTLEDPGPRWVGAAALVAATALTALGLLTSGCAAPTAPDEPIRLTAEAELLKHHNFPATMPDGTTVWVCATQPREYIVEGRTLPPTIDHYIQDGPCPDRPID